MQMIHPIDAHVGAILRKLRLERGLSQTELAKAGGVTFQQLQKYESGKNRVSASMLYTLAMALDTPIADFFPLPTDLQPEKKRRRRA